VQLAEPTSSAYFPAAQATHDASRPVVVVEYLPVAHSVQFADLVVEYFPEGHNVQLADPFWFRV
jgi:hypothetical protein